MLKEELPLRQGSRPLTSSPGGAPKGRHQGGRPWDPPWAFRRIWSPNPSPPARGEGLRPWHKGTIKVMGPDPSVTPQAGCPLPLSRSPTRSSWVRKGKEEEPVHEPRLSKVPIEIPHKPRDGSSVYTIVYTIVYTTVYIVLYHTL